MHAFTEISFQQRSISLGPYQLVARVCALLCICIVSIEFAYSLMNTPEKREKKERKRERKKMNTTEEKKEPYHPSVSIQHAS